MKSKSEIVSEKKVKSIAEQDSAIPRCVMACSTCYGFSGREMNHHWMLEFPEPDNGDEEADENFDFSPILICRHCDAKITEFDDEDENCPEY